MKPAERQLIPWLRAGGPAPQEIPAAAAGWIDIAEAGAATGLAGLLLERARRIGVDIPSPAHQKLHMASMAVAANGLHLARELTTVLSAFQQAGVPVMLLKGAALMPTIYRNYGLRPMSDLDLLVSPDFVDQALNVLAALGCRHGPALLRDDFFPKYYYEAELLTGSPRPARIDLHVRPFRPMRYARSIPDEAFWENRISVWWNEATAAMPCPELTFIHLAVHAAVHGCSRLLWLYDLRRLADHHGPSLDWGLVVDRAIQWRLALPVMRTIEQTTQLLGPIVPDGVVEGLATPRPTWRDRLALDHAPHDAARPVGQILVNLMTTPGIRFRIGYAWSLLIPGQKHLGQLYRYRHPGWTLLAQIWRVVRAVCRVALLIGGLIRPGIDRLQSLFRWGRVRQIRRDGGSGLKQPPVSSAILPGTDVRLHSGRAATDNLVA